MPIAKWLNTYVSVSTYLEEGIRFQVLLQSVTHSFCQNYTTSQKTKGWFFHCKLSSHPR